MKKKYLAKIIANDQEGLQMISACSAGAKVKVVDIKYLPSNKVFLFESFFKIFIKGYFLMSTSFRLRLFNKFILISKLAGLPKPL